MIEFSSYPVVIEPTVNAIELKVGDDSPLKWTQFRRIPSNEVNTDLGGIPAGLVHFFAPCDLPDSPVLLCYNGNGQLAQVMQRSDSLPGVWESFDIPSELSQGVVLLPSVRLTFETERARAAFLYYLDCVRKGSVACPSLAVALDKLVCDPIITDVAKQ